MNTRTFGGLIIEEIEDPETEKIVQETRGNIKELIKRLSIKAGILKERTTEEEEIEDVVEKLEKERPVNATMQPPTWEGLKGELSKTKQSILKFPYLTHIAIGLLLLAVLIGLIHLSTKPSVKKKVSNVFFEPKKKPKKKR